MKFILGKPENYCSQRNNKYKKTMSGNMGTSKMEAPSTISLRIDIEVNPITSVKNFMVDRIIIR